MRILGIETSCDETAVCLIEASGSFGPDFRFTVLGNALTSQAALHAQYGGVFPNLAKREHAKNLVPMLETALSQAQMLTPATTPIAEATLAPLHELLAREQELLLQIIPFLLAHERPDIDAIAVTAGPGLEPALWVGINLAKALAIAWDLPLIATNHMEGHVVVSMTAEDRLAPLEFPLLSLLISGGHTELVLSKEFQKYELIGQTRDDAAGEAFDKVARLLDLPYPGGPEISRLASEAREKNTKADFAFTRPMLREDNFDFSFSGLKTAVRKVVEANSPLADNMKMMIAREFEETVANVLVIKTMRAVDAYGANTVLIGGGVSANIYIKERLTAALAEAGNIAQLLTPPPSLATDNALMIALAGYFRAIKKEFAQQDELKADGNLKLST